MKKYITDMEFSAVDYDDYPDFVDAYIVSANWSDGIPLTKEELDELNNDNEMVRELLMQHLY